MPAMKRKCTDSGLAKKAKLRRDSTLMLETSEETSLSGSLRKTSIQRTTSKSSPKTTSSVSSLKRKATMVSEGSGIYSSIVALMSGSSVGKTGSLNAAALGKDCEVIPVSTAMDSDDSGSKTAEAISTLRKSVSKATKVEEEMTSGSCKETRSKRKSSVKEPSITKVPPINKSLSKRKSVTSGPDVTMDDTSAIATTRPPLYPGGLLEIAISFDTTGSMYSCLEEVRGRIKDMVQRLQADIPGIRIAVIAHGDYCDADRYVVKWIDFGSTVPELCEFVETVERTGGGDDDECYELVLRRAREVLSWTPGSQRSLVMIGDCNPHEPGYRYNHFVNDIDWRVEAKELKNMGVKIYSVSVRSSPLPFYQTIASITGGRLLSLDNFGVLFDVLMSICYRESGAELLDAYEMEVRDRHGDRRLDRTMEAMFTALNDTKAGRTVPAVESRKPRKLVEALRKAKTKQTGKIKPKAKLKPKEKKSKPKVGGIHRESLTDVRFVKGPLKRLAWSRWAVGVSKIIPSSVTKATGPHSNWKYQKWCEAFCNRAILTGEDIRGVPAVYEIAVRMAGKKKAYPVLCSVTKGVPTGNSWYGYLLSNKRVRLAVRDVVGSSACILVRRGTFKRYDSKFTQKVHRYLCQNHDYAWTGRRDRKFNFRNLKPFGFHISRDNY